MSEKSFQTKVMKYLKKNYPNAWIYNTCDMVRIGVPDILMLYEGNLYALELKIEGGNESRIQKYTIKKINAAGGFGGFCYSIDDIDKIIKKGE